MLNRFDSPSRKVFIFINTTFLVILGIVCLLPLIHILALSFSGKSAAAAGSVILWPVEFSTTAYTFVLNRVAFWRSMLVTIRRVLVGGTINLILITLTAYPLSKPVSKFRFRTFFAWFFFFSTLFSGGLIPSYMLIYQLNMLDSIWALILPGAVPVFSVILMLNFFRQIPDELEEAAHMDGANQWRTLFRIYIPCSLPSIATVALFSIVSHWNSYFDGMIFSNNPSSYPLQSYLRTIIVSSDLTNMAGDDWKLLAEISDRTVKAAQIFISALPILAVYPFLQKYFVKGITVGSVKG